MAEEDGNQIHAFIYSLPLPNIILCGSWLHTYFGPAGQLRRAYHFLSIIAHESR